MKKLLFVAITIISCTIFTNRVLAINISFEISGDRIDGIDGFYYCTKCLPVGEKLNLKAEEIIYNDMYIEGATMGETSRTDITDKCKWKSSNESVAKVTKGVVEGISNGVAEITATYNEKVIEFTVPVGEDVEIGIGQRIYITQKDNIKTIKQGETLQLNAEAVEMSPIKNEDVKWTSSNENVATINKNGIVEAKSIGKATIKIEYGSLTGTYEIEVIGESNEESPIESSADKYDLNIDKKQLSIDIGSSEKIEIKANLKDGIIMIAEFKEMTDNWDVTWKIEDEKIAKCIPEKGIVNNIYGAKQTVGRATIQGIREGDTNLLITVKIADNQFKKFSVPITINEKEANKEVPKEEKQEDKKKDNTTATGELPKTGENNFAIISIITIISIAIIYWGKKMK